MMKVCKAGTGVLADARANGRVAPKARIQIPEAVSREGGLGSLPVDFKPTTGRRYSPGQPCVLKAPAVENAVDHHRDALHVRLPACSRSNMEDYRVRDILL